MQQLRAFVHVSTHWVNNHLPRNSVVKERIYPLQLEVGGEPTSHRCVCGCARVFGEKLSSWFQQQLPRQALAVGGS